MEEIDHKHRLNKIMTEQEAVAAFFHDGVQFTVGGFSINRESHSVFREIARQGFKNLKYIEETSTEAIDILIGLGRVDRYDMSYITHRQVGGLLGMPCLDRCLTQGFPRPVNFGNFMSTPDYKGSEPPVEIYDWTNFMISLRFVAGALNVPFMPTRSSIGTDIPKYNQEIKTVEDPYENKLINLIPACRPDVAVISVQRADRRGNGQVWGYTAVDVWKARAAKHVILLAEEIVTQEKIAEHPSNTLIPAYCTDAVVHLPYNSHPYAVYGFYQADVLSFLGTMHDKQTHEGYMKWMDEWVFGCKNHYDYCDKIGWEVLDRLAKSEHVLNRIPR